MKLTKKIVALVAVLMTTASVLASEVTVITMLNGAANSNVGTVTHSEANGVCTLTVTPASGYYIDIITAEKTVSGISHRHLVVVLLLVWTITWM